MQQTSKGLVLAVATIVGALLLAVGFALSWRTDDAKSWKAAVTGFLAELRVAIQSSEVR